MNTGNSMARSLRYGGKPVAANCSRRSEVRPSKPVYSSNFAFDIFDVNSFLLCHSKYVRLAGSGAVSSWPTELF